LGFDFDMAIAPNNVVREYNTPVVPFASNYHDIIFEIKRQKSAARLRHWEINKASNENCCIVSRSERLWACIYRVDIK
jgi:hypothetical protein